jgi:16S rRNA (guanine527-N7)-methyltransferase
VTGDHARHLGALDLPPHAQRALAAYLDLLEVWSARVNLTGARTPQQRVEALVAEVLPAAPLPAPGRLLDVGSGNGSPGLVLAVVRPDLEATLLEPRARRWAFLREAVRVAGCRNVEVLRLRHDQYRGGPARSVTLRGLRLPLREVAGLVEEGGALLVFGGQPRCEAPFAPEGQPIVGRSRLFLFRRVSFT